MILAVLSPLQAIVVVSWVVAVFKLGPGVVRLLAEDLEQTE